MIVSILWTTRKISEVLIAVRLVCVSISWHLFVFYCLDLTQHLEVVTIVSRTKVILSKISRIIMEHSSSLQCRTSFLTTTAVMVEVMEAPMVAVPVDQTGGATEQSRIILHTATKLNSDLIKIYVIFAPLPVTPVRGCCVVRWKSFTEGYTCMNIFDSVLLLSVLYVIGCYFKQSRGVLWHGEPFFWND